MKPTSEQKQRLKDYLNKVMLYRETYEEVYDHMLLAIENHPEQECFTSAMVNILESDFGGSCGLGELERNCLRTVELTAKAQYWGNFKNWFTSLLLIVTAAIYLGLYYLSMQFGGEFMLLFVLILILPTILFCIRGFRLGYARGNNKRSIRDAIIRRLTFKANWIFFYVCIISGIVDRLLKYFFNYHRRENIVDYNILLLMILALIIHNLSVIQLHNSELKTGFAK
jgi:hypothetical protein